MAPTSFKLSDKHISRVWIDVDETTNKYLTKSAVILSTAKITFVDGNGSGVERRSKFNDR